MIITISGAPGSGKSTIAKILQQKLSGERIYVGGIRRDLARKKGMTLVELNEYAKTHPETDVDVDKEAAAEARKLAQQGKTVIVEGRTQYYFLPESFKIFITVDSNEGTKRIWKDLQNPATKEQRNEGEFRSVDELKRRIQQRSTEDNKRYLKYYGINPGDESQYDFIIDTTKISAEQAAQLILTTIKSKKTL